MAATLTAAAHLSYDRAATLWAGGTLKVQFGLFIDDVSPIFEDAIPNDRPVGNWVVPMRAVHGSLGIAVRPSQLNSVVELLYRICLAGAAQLAASNISGAQATALLAAWNARIGP